MLKYIKKFFKALFNMFKKHHVEVIQDMSDM